MNFIDALKSHLTKNKEKFHAEWEDETGFGSTYHAEHLDMDKLMKEIDKFCLKFNKQSKKD